MKRSVVTAVLASAIGFTAAPALAKEADAKPVDQGAAQQQQMPVPTIQNSGG